VPAERWGQALRFRLGLEGLRRPIEALGLEQHGRALLVFAHPDDEINAAGLVLRLRAAGVEVDLLVLTDGAANPWTDAEVVGGRSQFECRAEELRASTALLGLKSLRIPGLPDSKLSSHLFEAVTLVSQALSERPPGLVVTFDANGINRHPDHVAAHQAVRRALQGRVEGPALAMLLPPPPFSLALGAGFRWLQQPTVATLTLTDTERETKAKVFDAHRSQWRTLRLLTAGLSPRVFFRLFPHEWFLWLDRSQAAAWANDEAAS
jgi:LmbE family N-acetylglucosaminyl deacetylase